MKNNFLRIMSLTVFLIFLALYYSSNAGIIDYQARNRTALTEEQIKMFEDDVKNNVEIDIKKYLDDKEEKYDIFKSERENSTFVEYAEKYYNYDDKKDKDQDILDFDVIE